MDWINIELNVNIDHQDLEGWRKWKNTGTSRRRAARVVQVLPESAHPINPAGSFSSRRTSRSCWAASLLPQGFLSPFLFPFSFLLLWHSWGVWCHSGFLGVLGRQCGSRGNLILSAPAHTHTFTILLSKADSCEPEAFLGYQLVKELFLKPGRDPLEYISISNILQPGEFICVRVNVSETYTNEQIRYISGRFYILHLSGSSEKARKFTFCLFFWSNYQLYGAKSVFCLPLTEFRIIHW